MSEASAMSRLSLCPQLLRLWFEPWEGAHPSWLGREAAPPGWPAPGSVSPPGLRLLYWRFCGHFCLPGLPGAVLSPARLQMLERLPVGHEGVRCAAVFLGMVACASESGFAGGLALQAGAPRAGGGWREALRLARARPLPSGGRWRPGCGEDGLALLGLWQIRALADALQDGLWSRLRLRCDRAMVGALGACAGGPLDDAAARHILRAWQLAGAPGDGCAPNIGGAPGGSDATR